MSDVRSKGKRSLMVVRGKELVQQTARRLAEQGVETNIYQGDNTRETGAAISIASIQTLYSRKKIPDFDLLVIDECHNSRGASYEWLFENSADKKILSVTATPYHKKGMRHCADVIVYPIGITELQSLGYLVKGRYFAVQKPDLKGIKKIGDDYDQRQLGAHMESQLNGDAVKEWRRRADGRPTIIFAVSVSHSYAVCKLFNEAGIITRHVDAKTSDADRAEIFGLLKSGDINAVCNVGVLTTGVDIPEVSCLQVMRPTMSKALWHQMLGRATRISTGKNNFIVLDHSNNTMKHGMIEDEAEGNLDPLPKRKKKGQAAMTVHECPVCMAMFHAWPCPDCGEGKKSSARKLKTNEDVDLQELTAITREREIIKEIIGQARALGHQKGRCWYKLVEALGKDRGQQVYNQLVIPMEWVPLKAAQRRTTDY